MILEAFKWGPFLFFALINALTPGPNIILLASSGGHFGFRKTIPHLLGVCFGFPVMVVLVLYGSDRVFVRWPWIFVVLTACSLGYVLWLAVRIYQMGFASNLKFKSQSRPMSFSEGVSFQWINGKAWQVALMTATLYPTQQAKTRLLIGLALALVTLFAGGLWIELGARIAGFLKRPLARKLYCFLATALLVSTWPTGVSQLLDAVR